MVDIHSHILPCVDDGSPSVEMSVRMLSRYAEQGVTDVFCTPHQNRVLARADRLRAAFAALKERASHLPVRLYLGAEIYYYGEMIRDLEAGRLLTMNGTRYVLVEFSSGYPAESVPDAVYELKAAGYVPVVAHIERYFYLNREDFFAVKQNGGLIQINASSLSDKREKRRAHFLLRHGLADFIASDCHDEVRRPPDFSAAVRAVRRKYAGQRDKLFCANQNVHLRNMTGGT